MCSRFVDKIRSSKNFSDSFVVGSRNLKTSAFKDHAASEMHRRAMAIFGKEQSSGNPIEYAPIARALLDDAAAAKVGRKFEITYLICKEHVAFAKMESLCQLEVRHGVDLGSGHKNEKACALCFDVKIWTCPAIFATGRTLCQSTF